MAKLIHDEAGKHFYETGVQECVLYPVGTEATVNGHKTKYVEGFAWNGITTITESPSGAEATPLYADNRKYLNLISNEDFGLTVEAYTYPDEFADCDGSSIVMTTGDTPADTGLRVGQQTRKMFGLCYKTLVGNDEEAASDKSYKLHIVYGCTAAPSERAYATVNDTPEAITFSWEITTTPVDMTNFRPIAHLEIDSSKATSANLQTLIDNLYGKDATTGVTPTDEIVPHLPMPDDVKTILAATT